MNRFHSNLLALLVVLPLPAAWGQEGGAEESRLPVLVERLGDPLSREAAIEALFPVAEEATPLLLKAAAPGKPLELRLGAILALGRLRIQAAVPVLARQLADPRARVRLFAVRALGHIGGSPAAKPVLGVLRDSDSGVRAAAAEALGLIGTRDAIAGLIALLDDGKYHVRLSSVRALERLTDLSFGEDLARWKAWHAAAAARRAREERIRALAPKLKSVEDGVRIRAALEMAACGEDALPVLSKLLLSRGPRSSKAALLALWDMGRRADRDLTGAVVDTLLLSVSRTRVSVGSEVVDILHSMGPKVIEPLADAIGTMNANKRWVMTRVLVRFGRVAVPELIRVMKERKGRAKSAVAAVISSMGQAAMDPLMREMFLHGEKTDPGVRFALVDMKYLSFPALLRAVRTYDERVRDMIASVVLSMSGGVREELLPLLSNGDWRVRQMAARALCDPNEELAAAQTTGLLLLLEDSRYEVRRASALTLASKGDARAKDALVPLLRDPEAGVRRQAAGLLGMLKDRRGLPCLRRMLESGDRAERKSATSWLCYGGDRSVVPGLARQLEDEDFWTRRAAVRALGATRSSLAAAPLVGVLDDREEDVRIRLQAAEALYRLNDPDALSALKRTHRSSDDPCLNVKCAELLYRWRPAEDLKAFLMKSLTTATGPERVQAARSAGALKLEEALDPLMAMMLDKNRTLGEAAARAVGGYGAGARPALVAFLAARSKDTRRFYRHYYVFSIALRTMAEQDMDAVLPLLENENQRIRQIAVQACSWPRNKKAVAALKKMLESNDRYTRHAALWALARIGAEETFELLIKNMMSTSTSYTYYLARIGRPLVPRLLACLDQEEPHLRARTIRLLQDIGDVRAVAPLVRLLEDERSVVRRVRYYSSGPRPRTVAQAAHQALRHITGLDLPGAPGPWKSWLSHWKALGSDVVQARLLAVSALGRAKGKPWGRMLVDTLGDEDERVRRAARRALRRGRDGFRPLLLDALGSHRPRVRRQAAAVLAETRDGSLAPAFIDFLQDCLRSWRDWEGCRAAKAFLEDVTGRSFGYDVDRWRAWLEKR